MRRVGKGGKDHVLFENGTIVWFPSVVSDSVKFGENCSVGAFSEIGENVEIGYNVRIGAQCFIPEGITIGNNVFIGPAVKFANDKYPPSYKKDWAATVVHDNVSIGIGAIILPGVNIHSGALIGAGAVVTKDVQPDTVVVGNPAGVI